MSRKLKRPSSARRNIKIETFSPFVSGSRLCHVQSLLTDDTADEKKPDAVICVAGIDSRYNDGNSELINYLLFGFFDSRKAELEKSGFEEEVLDDLVIVIRPHEVDVYCNPINYHYLMPYVSHWRNLRFHCMTEKEYEDEDAAGDFKVKSFISMLKGCRKIGIPYSIAGHVQPFDKMMVEKWPLIQAFALEDYGGGGFFTLNYEVCDVSQELSSIYNKLDPVGLENIVVENLIQFERQWNTLITMLNLDMSTEPENLTEEKVCEPLKSYYLHGIVGTSAIKIEQEPPYVLFGVNSRKSVLDSVRSGSKTEKNKLTSTGIDGSAARFMVCRGVSPKCSLSCVRTYFFTEEFSDPFQDQSAEKVESPDTRCLIQMYSAMVESVMEGIKVYTSTLSVHKARAAAVEKLCEQCTEINNPVINKYLQRRSNIVFTLEAYSNVGCQCPVVDGQRSLMVKSICLYLMDIPSVTQPNKCVGSLGFSEVFLDSVIKVQKRDGTQMLDSQVLVLTESFPCYKAWHVSGNGNTLLPELESKLNNSLKDRFGQLLLPGESAHVSTSGKMTRSPVEVQLYVYNHALVFLRPETGALLLDQNAVHSLLYYDGDEGGTVIVLIVEVTPSVKSRIPSFLLSQDNRIYISFTPKTKAYKHMFTQVLPQWRSESSLPAVQRIDSLPQEYLYIHSTLQTYHQTVSSHAVMSGFTKAIASLPNFRRFLSHFSASSVSDLPLPESVIPAMSVVDQPLDTDRSIQEENAGVLPGQIYQGDKIIVTIISGVLSSHKENVCDTVTDSSKDRYSWTVLKQPLDSTEPFVPKMLQRSLASLVSASRRKRSASTLATKPRVLVLIPGCLDIVDVVQAIECHPDPEVRLNVKIGAVTACVDPLNSFLERKLTMPNLLNHCAQGWVNNIIFTSSTSIQNVQLSEIQTLLRAINNDVAFFLADKGLLNRSMDIDAVLSESSFMEMEKVRARHLLCPGWTLGLWKSKLEVNNMHSEIIRFSQPLEKKQLLNNLHALKSSLREFPCEGNIYSVQGLLTFSGSSQQMQLHYTTLSENLNLKPAQNDDKSGHSLMNGDGGHRNKGENYVVFTGIDLQRKKLQDWLRTCAKQKPEKKKMINRKDLSREDIKKIHKDRHLDPLPAGWFYNGTQFVSFDGEKQNNHPSLEDFVKNYIDEKNQEISNYNAEVDIATQKFVDLFN